MVQRRGLVRILWMQRPGVLRILWMRVIQRRGVVRQKNGQSLRAGFGCDIRQSGRKTGDLGAPTGFPLFDLLTSLANPEVLVFRF